MTDWTLVLLTPLVVLPVILLFRFVGCGLDAVGTLPPSDPAPPFGAQVPSPTYSDHILGGPYPLYYWRLNDQGPPKAKDETYHTDGEYKHFPPQPLPLQAPVPPAPPDPNTVRSPAGSEAADGSLQFGQQGLISFDAGTSVRFLGGLVEVHVGNYPPSFTIEAWVFPEWDLAGGTSKRGFNHVLMEVYEPGANQPRGFRIFANQFDRWQVLLWHVGATAPGPLFDPNTPTGPVVQLQSRQHVAVTYKAGTLALYVNGQLAGAQSSLPYSPPQEYATRLYIAQASPAQPAGRPFPFLGRIQEIAIYDDALSDATIKKHYTLNPPSI